MKNDTSRRAFLRLTGAGPIASAVRTPAGRDNRSNFLPKD
jgi:hypothetical protein